MERGREFDPFDPAQKRILANNRSLGEAKILDSCSRSQIHLWSKSKILRRRAILDGETSRYSTARAHAVESERLKSQISNLKSTDPLIEICNSKPSQLIEKRKEVKYLALTFGERVGFVSHLPLRALGIPLLGIRHLRRSESYTA
jgi:hypothetical protein